MNNFKFLKIKNVECIAKPFLLLIYFSKCSLLLQKNFCFIFIEAYKKWDHNTQLNLKTWNKILAVPNLYTGHQSSFSSGLQLICFLLFTTIVVCSPILLMYFGGLYRKQEQSDQGS